MSTHPKKDEAPEKAPEKARYDFYEKPEASEPAPDKPQAVSGAQPPPVVTLAATASLFVIPPMKSLNDGLGAGTGGATLRPGLSAPQATLPVTPQNMQNGGMPTLTLVVPFVGDGVNYYVPLPKNSIILSIQASAMVAATAGTLVFGNDTPVGASDLGSVTVNFTGLHTVTLASAAFTGLLGNNLQMTTPVDTNLQGVAVIQYVVRGG